MRLQLVRVLGLGGLVAAALLAVPPVADAAKRDDTLVREVNSRWNGARCRLLFDISIKKKTIQIVKSPLNNILYQLIGNQFSFIHITLKLLA